MRSRNKKEKADEFINFAFQAHVVSIEKFIAGKITGGSKDKANISKPIVKIAVTGIVLGVAVMLVTISIVIGFKQEISRKITGLTTHITISSITMNPGNEPLPITVSDDT